MNACMFVCVSEHRSGLQCFDPGSEQQNVLVHLGAELGLRRPWVCLDKLCNALDTFFLLKETHTLYIYVMHL